MAFSINKLYLLSHYILGIVNVSPHDTFFGVPPKTPDFLSVSFAGGDSPPPRTKALCVRAGLAVITPDLHAKLLDLGTVLAVSEK